MHNEPLADYSNSEFQKTNEKMAQTLKQGFEDIKRLQASIDYLRKLNEEAQQYLETARLQAGT